ncbi:MAG: hypothetical protein OXP68_04135 [Anaerolineaceae bacterium]|nr:hypothetical protein [Anaerolineaceae bacterium]MDE0327876.1 hypothetical protein [Anaerolineaceae bacterium]
MRQFAILSSVLLLLAGAVLAQAQMAIDGLNEDDIALLNASGLDADTLHFDISLNASVAGDPTLAMGVDLAGSGAVGVDAMGLPLMTVDLEGASSAGELEATPAILRLRLVDNILYLLMNEKDGWQVMPLEEGLADAGLPADTSEIAGAQAVDVLGWLESLGLDAFSSGVRSEADGMATILIEVDMGAWLRSPAFNDLMTVAGDVTQDDSLAAMGPMLGMLLQDLLLTIESMVELDSGLMRAMGLNLGLAIDAAALGGGAQAQTTEVSLTIAFDNMRYGGDVEVSVPEGAVLADA